MRDLSRGLVRLASRIVPRSLRREFRDEWEAELSSGPMPTRSRRDRLRTAARAFGVVPDALFLFSRQWSLDMIGQDLRYAFRVLMQRRAYTALVLTTLAISIGAATAVFSAIDAVLLRALPYHDPSKLVQVWENDRVNGKPRYPVAPANWADWRAGTHAFEHLTAYVESGGSLSLGADPFHVSVPVVATDFFDTLGVHPALGRAFEARDAVPPNHRVLVLANAVWRNRFGSDPRVIGRTVNYNGVDYRIVGVMPGGFEFPARNVDGWRPIAETPDALQTRAQHFLSVVGRVRPGVTMSQASADLEAVAIADQKRYPATNDQRGTTMVPLQEAITGDARDPMLLIAAAVSLLLAISALNVANLTLVEGAARRREIAVRSALGADRFRIIRQLVVEGLLLAGAGGALGVACARFAVQAFGRVAIDYVPRIGSVAIDGRVLAFAMFVSLATGVLFGLAPALAASRPDVQHELREGARGTVRRTHGARGVLVVVEFAAAVVLVIAAGLVAKSFWNVVSVQPGFAGSHVLTASFELPSRYEQDPQIAQFYDGVLARLAGRPGVRASGIVNNLPVSNNAWTSWLTLENAPRPAGEPPEVGYRTASPGYFTALQIPVIEGRGISDVDTATSLKVAVVNRSLAARFFPNGRVIGTRVRLGPNPKAPWRTIVGIVGDVHHAGPDMPVDPEAFLPAAQDVNSDMQLAVRTDGDPAALAGAIREAVHDVDPTVTVWQVRTMDGIVDEHLAPRRLALYVIEGFAAIALALALIGIYGVLSYTVSQRVPEIGVRMALGAQRGEILKRTIGDGLRLAAPGIAIGIGLAFAGSRAIRAVLFDVSPTDPVAYVVLTTAVLGVAVLACYLPARRASRIDPLSAIRS
ncbi:MAG TPA: ABC transporter permease [Vicinamibacterales bacterium]|nr:ABC transporter permease [Vicinamibacterales bacterium]